MNNILKNSEQTINTQDICGQVTRKSQNILFNIKIKSRMNKLIILLMLAFMPGVFYGQVTLDAKKMQMLDPKINQKAKLSQKFDISKTKTVINNGIKTKWTMHNSHNKDMKVKESNHKKSPSKNNNEECMTITRTIDVNSATFMNSSSDLTLSKIYAGGIYPADDFLKGNYNREIKKNRTPIILKSNDSRFGKSITINTPNEVKIEDARKSLLNTIANKNTSNNLEMKYRVFYSSNEIMKELMLSAGAGGYGARVDVSMSNKQSSKTVTLTVDAYKSIYAIDAVSAGENEYFTELPAGVKANNLIIVNSVAYGSRILANLTIECKSTEDAAKLAASYSGFGFSASLSVSNMSKHTEKNITLNYKQVGGPNLSGTMSFDPSQLQKKIDEILSKTTYANAVPISYNVRDLVGNNMGIQSTVDKYTETLCSTNAYVTSAFVKVKSGKDGKNDDNYVRYDLYSNKEIKDNTRMKMSQIGAQKFPVHSPIAAYKQTRKEEYKKGSTVGPFKLTKNSGETYMKNLMADGGYLVIWTNHEGGKDDWYIDQVILTIEFSDGSTKDLKWPEHPGPSIKIITKDNNSAKFYFDQVFKAKN